MTAFRPALLALGALAMIGAIAYGQLMRVLLMPATLQYVPKEATIVVTTGPIEEVWRSFDQQFGHSLRNSDEPGHLADMLESIQSGWEDLGVEVHGLADLARLGIDRQRGMAIGAVVPGKLTDAEEAATQYVTIIPVVNQPAFTTTLMRLSESEEVTDTTISAGDQTLQVLCVGDYFLAYPDQSTAVVATSLPLLARSLLSRRSNLRYARDNDHLFESVRRQVRMPLFRGANVFVLWQPRNVQALTQLATAWKLEASGVTAAADVELEANGVRLLDDAFQRPAAGPSWAEMLPVDVAGALMIQDSELARYLQFGTSVEELDRVMNEQFGGILAELREVEGLRRIVVAVTGYRRGLPDVVLGTWGDSTALARAVYNVQRESLTRRNRALLAAVSQRAAPEADAQSAELPYPEPGLWPGQQQQYTKASGTEQTVPNSAASGYAFAFRGRTVEYLLPRLTRNDLHLRPEFEGLDSAVLLNDEYRLVATRTDTVLWIAPDTFVMGRMVSVLTGQEKSLAQHHAFLRATRTWETTDKLQMFLDVDRGLRLGLLSPESNVADNVKQLFLDLRAHPAVSARLPITKKGRRARLELDLFRRENSR